MDKVRAAQVRRFHREAYGPRVPGGTYRNEYHGQDYEVLAMWSDRAGGWARQPFMRVRWADGSTSEHCTRWDPSGDRVVRQPARRVPQRRTARGRS
jgi:hypothetical protein